MDQLYIDHVKGSRELIAWDMDVLPRDPAALLRCRRCPAAGRDASWTSCASSRTPALPSRSSATGSASTSSACSAAWAWHDLPVATNATVLGRGGAGVTFPYGHPACLVCGTCKRERVRRHQEAGRAVVFVGDGPSDRYAAHHADVVFAKASLADWCERAGHQRTSPGRASADVADWVETALADGRLPADRRCVRRLGHRRPTRRAPIFICGPEVWGEDRTVAADEEPGGLRR